MRDNARALWPWLLVLVVLAASIGLAGSGALVTEGGSIDMELGILLLLPAWYVGLGAVLITRAPGNRIAWILGLVGTGFVFEGLAGLRVGIEPPVDPTVWDVLAITWLNTGFFFALVIPLVLLLFLFPTGRFLSRRWVWAGWVAGVASVAVIFGEAFATEIGPDDGTGSSLWTIANPIGFLDHPGLENAGPLSMIFGLGLLLLLVTSIPAIVVRYRRSQPDVRAQIKWVILALLLVAVTFFARIVLDIRFGTADYLFPIAMAALPLSMTLAIVRYRLFEIDRLISRTLSYTLVVGILGLVYVFGAVWLPTRLVGENVSPIFVAGSTLAVAALFNPLRKRVQLAVDRRFNRSALHANTVLEEFAAQLREPHTADQLVGVWSQTVVDAFHPRSLGIWVNQAQTDQ